MEQIIKRTSSKLPNYKERRLLASISPWVDTNCFVKKTYKTALPKSRSTAQQHCNYTTNYHQVSAEERVKENEDINNYGQP
jgi:hypothetical protein